MPSNATRDQEFDIGLVTLTQYTCIERISSEWEPRGRRANAAYRSMVREPPPPAVNRFQRSCHEWLRRFRSNRTIQRGSVRQL